MPFKFVKCGHGIWISFVFIACSCPGVNCAQSKLSLQEAVDQALQSRASLKAQAEEIAAANGLKRQAGAIANPEFQYQSENLRPEQTFSQDVDTFALLAQPLDIFGKRKQRILVADRAVGLAQAEYERARRTLVQRVKLAYWAARGGQERLRLLKATVDNFQKIVDYHSAQLSQGAISEQDFLRIRLESERLKISAELAAIEEARARVRLQKEMGRTDFPEVVLTESLAATSPSAGSMNINQVLARNVDMGVQRANLGQAEAKARLQDIAVRPDLSVIFGYKRTQLFDVSTGANTAVAGAKITLPIFNRNRGNREAAAAEVRQQRQALAETTAEVRADYYGAVQEYEMRRHEVTEALEPLREHGADIAEIAQLAYVRGGTDLLRLLDAERARLDAELAWVQGMVEYHQSVVNLEAAEGVSQ